MDLLHVTATAWRKSITSAPLLTARRPLCRDNTPILLWKTLPWHTYVTSCRMLRQDERYIALIQSLDVWRQRASKPRRRAGKVHKNHSQCMRPVELIDLIHWNDRRRSTWNSKMCENTLWFNSRSKINVTLYRSDAFHIRIAAYVVQISVMPQKQQSVV